MIKENDRVVLKSDIQTESLVAGDVGTVVRVFRGTETYEVEFQTWEGEPVCLTTVHASQVRPVAAQDILHARQRKIDIK